MKFLGFVKAPVDVFSSYNAVVIYHYVLYVTRVSSSDDSYCLCKEYNCDLLENTKDNIQLGIAVSNYCLTIKQISMKRVSLESH